MFNVGDTVGKTGGDYRFDGVVVAAFSKLSGLTRYVVEDAKGQLHIFSDSNLVPRELEYQNILNWAADLNVLVYDADSKGKSYPSRRLEQLLEEHGRNKFCSEMEYTFKLDEVHENYVTKTLGMTLPTGCNHLLVAKFKNDKYLLGAY